MRIEKRSVSDFQRGAHGGSKNFINPKQKNVKPEEEFPLYIHRAVPSEFKEQQRGTEINTKNNGQLSERSVLISRVPGISRRDALLHNRANL